MADRVSGIVFVRTMLPEVVFVALKVPAALTPVRVSPPTELVVRPAALIGPLWVIVPVVASAVRLPPMVEVPKRSELAVIAALFVAPVVVRLTGPPKVFAGLERVIEFAPAVKVAFPPTVRASAGRPETCPIAPPVDPPPFEMTVRLPVAPVLIPARVMP
jgi:hypothetical protein